MFYLHSQLIFSRELDWYSTFVLFCRTKKLWTPHPLLPTVATLSTAIVNDPAFDAPITILVDELLLAWIERDNYLIEIRQK